MVLQLVAMIVVGFCFCMVMVVPIQVELATGRGHNVCVANFTELTVVMGFFTYTVMIVMGFAFAQ